MIYETIFTFTELKPDEIDKIDDKIVSIENKKKIMYQQNSVENNKLKLELIAEADELKKKIKKKSTEGKGDLLKYIKKLKDIEDKIIDPSYTERKTEESKSEESKPKIKESK